MKDRWKPDLVVIKIRTPSVIDSPSFSTFAHEINRKQTLLIMKEFGLKSVKSGLEVAGIRKVKEACWNLTPAKLIESAVHDEEGHLTDTGALMCDTGKFTGRSPQDRFIVEDEVTKDKVWWGDINKPISSENFDRIHTKMIGYLEEKRVYVLIYCSIWLYNNFFLSWIQLRYKMN